MLDILNIYGGIPMSGTTIKISEETHNELNKIKGYFLIKDGKEKSFNEVIKEILTFWRNQH